MHKRSGCSIWKNGGGGFILPTAVVSGVILLALLTASLQLTASSANALREQHYLQLAKEAAEAGMVWLRGCMQASQRPILNKSYPVNATSCKDPAPNASSSQYFYADTKIGMRYGATVSNPSNSADANKITSIGYVDLMRPSGGVWKTVSYANTTIVSELDLSAGGTVIFNEGYRKFAIRPDGAVWGWGDNSEGLLLGTEAPRAQYVPARILTNVQKMIPSGAGTSRFVLRQDGSVWGWGESYPIIDDDRYHILGDRKEGVYPPVEIIASDTKDIFSVNGTIFALKKDNSLWAWGANEDGEVGNGKVGGSQRNPVQIMPPSPSPVIKMAGNGRVMALKSDGTIWAWGHGLSATPKKISIPAVQDVAHNYIRTLLLLRDGRVMLWEWGATSPDHINGLTNIKRVYNLFSAYYAIDSHGALFLWAQKGATGILGDGSNRAHRHGHEHPAIAPIRIIGSGVVDFQHSNRVMYALKKDGALLAWGFNDTCGLLDTNKQVVVLRPKEIMRSVKKNYVGSSGLYGGRSAALLNNNDLMTWGAYPGDGGPLSNSVEHHRCTPFRVMSNVQDVFLTNTGYYAIDYNAQVWSWGMDSWSASAYRSPGAQLGRGMSARGNTPGLIRLPDWRIVY